jgi:hypothetical protein
MGPCIINVFKHNQQDATLHNGIYYYKCSTCFRRFLRPSSGAQNCLQSMGYLSSFSCFLPLSLQLTHNSGKKQENLDTKFNTSYLLAYFWNSRTIRRLSQPNVWVATLDLKRHVLNTTIAVVFWVTAPSTLWVVTNVSKKPFTSLDR